LLFLPFFLPPCFALTLLAVEERAGAPPEARFRFWTRAGEVRPPGELTDPGVSTPGGDDADGDPSAGPELEDKAADDGDEARGADAGTDLPALAELADGAAAAVERAARLRCRRTCSAAVAAALAAAMARSRSVGEAAAGDCVSGAAARGGARLS
jgi:hypothetical protein